MIFFWQQGKSVDFVEGIDADDNGFFPKIEANYKVKTISNIIKLFNPSFDSYEDYDEQFLKAVDVAKKIFVEEIFYINGKVIADKEVNYIVDNMEDNSKYLFLDKFLPYEDALLNNQKANNILFVAFPSNRGGFTIKTVPKSSIDRSSRLEFPEEWAGLTDSSLEEVSGIKGLRFCHTSRFIVNCSNIEAVYAVLDRLCK